MIDEVSVEPAKYVVTKDHGGKENGFLIEMFKDGEKTVVYLSAASPGAFKGYHLHRVRAARYVCLKGRMRIILYQRKARSGSAKSTSWTRASRSACSSRRTSRPASRTSVTKTAGW